MKCKYCDARLDRSLGVSDNFECGTQHEHVTRIDGIWSQSDTCKELVSSRQELARYRAMFPVPPWSTDPITDDTCKAVGLILVDTPEGARWRLAADDRFLEVFTVPTSSDTWVGSNSDCDMDSGWLSLQVAAARKMAESNQPGD